MKKERRDPKKGVLECRKRPPLARQEKIGVRLYVTKVKWGGKVRGNSAAQAGLD